MRNLILSVAVFLATVIAHGQYAPSVPPTSGVLGYWSTDAGSVLRITKLRRQCVHQDHAHFKEGRCCD